MPKQSIPIELGDKTRHLRYDFNAFELIQEKLNISPFDLEAVLGISFEDAEKAKSDVELAELAKSIDFKKLKILIQIGLLHEDESITENDVGKWLDMGNFAQAIGCFVDAYLPHDEGEGEEKNESSPGEKKEPTSVIPGKNTNKKPIV